MSQNQNYNQYFPPTPEEIARANRANSARGPEFTGWDYARAIGSLAMFAVTTVGLAKGMVDVVPGAIEHYQASQYHSQATQAREAGHTKQAKRLDHQGDLKMTSATGHYKEGMPYVAGSILLSRFGNWVGKPVADKYKKQKQ